MKYMGSKRAMLKNGLGEILLKETKKSTRFFDLFSGSGAVATFISTNTKNQVIASDIQEYSVAISRPILERIAAIDSTAQFELWAKSAQKKASKIYIPKPNESIEQIVIEARAWSEQQNLPITRAYGGHYFSPTQSVLLDSLRSTLPDDKAVADIFLSALIMTASKISASPGHTAQPFQPKGMAAHYLAKSWDLDVLKTLERNCKNISSAFSKVRGKTYVSEALDMTKDIDKGDVAFIDPPYSGVHYSRFYHVLETIAAGKRVSVTGVGRYPPKELRPQSEYSLKTQSSAALDALLGSLSKKVATSIITFPAHQCSNGLSGDIVHKIAKKHGAVKRLEVSSVFSTLGGGSMHGTTNSLNGRIAAKELIFVITP